MLFYIRLLHFSLIFCTKKVLLAKNFIKSGCPVFLLWLYKGFRDWSNAEKNITKTHLLSAGHILLLAPCFCLLLTCCYLLLCGFLLLFCLLGPVDSCFLLFFSVSLVAFRVSLWLFCMSLLSLYIFICLFCLWF